MTRKTTHPRRERRRERARQRLNFVHSDTSADRNNGGADSELSDECHTGGTVALDLINAGATVTAKGNLLTGEVIITDIFMLSRPKGEQ